MRNQQHPQEKEDRQVVNQLISAKEIGDFELTELGRLLIRYQNFPGALELQRDLQNLLQNWQLTQQELFVKTRTIHACGSLRTHNSDQEQQDWS